MKNCKALCKVQTASRLNKIIQSFFYWFLLALRLSARKSEIKKNTYMMSTGTSEQI